MQDNKTSLKGQYFLGLSVALLLGVGAFIISQEEAKKGSRGIAQEQPTPVVRPQDLERMTNDDRAQVYNRLRQADQFLTEHCTRQSDGTSDLSETCGRVNNISNGDPNFRPELLNEGEFEGTRQFANIPRNSNINVSTRCEEDGRFYTRVTYTDENGQTRVFRNPYNGQTRAITSPGQLANPAYTTRGLPINQSFRASGYITAWHVTSDNTSYPGMPMPWSVWLNNTGNAYHAGTSATPVDGYPASAGCFRLETDWAKAIFRLAQRVGTNRMSFQWGGYNGPDGRVCRRPDGEGTSPLAANQTQEESTQSRNNIFTGISNWWRRVTGQSSYPETTRQTTPRPEEISR